MGLVALQHVGSSQTRDRTHVSCLAGGFFTIELCFLGLQNHYRWWLQPWNYKMFAPWKKSYDQPRQHIKKQRHHFTDKGPYSQSYGFSSSHVWMWELDHEEGWVLMNWCLLTVVLEKTLESPLDNKEIQPVNPKGTQSWIFIGRTDAEAETLVLWPPDAKNWLIGKDPDAAKDWGHKEKKRMKWLDGITNSMDIVWANSGREWRTEKPGMLQSMGLRIIGHNLAIEQ